MEFPKGRDGVSRRFAAARLDTEMLHFLLVIQDGRRQGLPDAPLKAAPDFLPYCHAVIDREGHDVVQINPICHVIDIKPQIVGINLYGVKVPFPDFVIGLQLDDFSFLVGK